MGYGQAASSKRGGLSHTPFINRNTFDVTQTPYGNSLGTVSPEMDRHLEFERKMERSQRRWEIVLDRKQREAESKLKQMKDMLAKKFKREREMEKNMKEKSEVAEYKREKVNGRIDENSVRKKTQDQKEEQRKIRELKESLKR